MENFQQILYVVPHFYIYKWEKLSSRSYLLFVDIPRNFKEMLTMEVTGSTDFRRLQSAYDPAERSLQEKDLQDRKEYFRNILINITNDYHQSFLERNSIQFDALASRTWHSNFDLIKHVEEIPIFELQGHQEVHVQTISDILNDNDYKTPLFRLALEEVDVCNDRKDSSQLPSKEFASKLPVGFERKVFAFILDTG